MAKFNLTERWLLPGRDGVCCATLRPQTSGDRMESVTTDNWLQADRFSTKIVAFEIYRTNIMGDLHLVLPADIYTLLYRGMEFQTR